jgi:hypothetical protein
MKRGEKEALSRHLDGELERDDLPRSLREDAAAFERIAAALGRGPVALPPTVRTVVMARVRALAASPWRRSWRWATAPRLSPLAAGVVLAGAVAALLLVRSRAPAGARAETTVAEQTVPVRLSFPAPGAARVTVTGDFASWDPAGIPLADPDGDGVWRVELRLAPGLHHYLFVVDGTEWQPDPGAASQVDDGFGRKNSVLVVPGLKAG